jgi:hypothetical protein
MHDKPLSLIGNVKGASGGPLVLARREIPVSAYFMALLLIEP